MRLFYIVILTIFSMSATAMAMDFDVKSSDTKSALDSFVEVTLSGEIVPGDAGRLKLIMAEIDDLDVEYISFIIDSSGGSLLEGIELGKLISSRSEITKAFVGADQSSSAICASACVFVYLGADFRYIGAKARIGVHQFNDPDTALKGYEALSLSQEISADLLNYIVGRGVDPAFLERMGKTEFDGIDWVNADLLREWRVVTDDIIEEVSVFQNAKGKLSLMRKQLSVNGQNGITLSCLREMVFAIAFFDKPKLEGIGSFQIIINGTLHAIPDFRVANDASEFLPVAFFVPTDLASAVANAQSLGARIVARDGHRDFRYDQKVSDEKLKDLAIECVPALRDVLENQNTGDVWKSMTKFPDIDIVGADLTQKGIQNITFDECQEICTEYVQCKAVSYVISRQWCWPKSSSEKKRPTAGVISAEK